MGRSILATQNCQPTVRVNACLFVIATGRIFSHLMARLGATTTRTWTIVEAGQVLSTVLTLLCPGLMCMLGNTYVISIG